MDKYTECKHRAIEFMYEAFDRYESGNDDADRYAFMAGEYFEWAAMVKGTDKPSSYLAPGVIIDYKDTLCEVVKSNCEPYCDKRKYAYVIAIDNSFADYIDMDKYPFYRDERHNCPECGQDWALHKYVGGNETEPPEMECPKPDFYDLHGGRDYRKEHKDYVQQIVFPGDDIQF